MKKYLLFFIFFICFPALNFAQSVSQSIFNNSIDGHNPSDTNPYNTDQTVDPNITVSGIGRAPGMYGINAKDRYDARSWKTEEPGPDTYFEFNLAPKKDHEIDFISFEYTGKVSNNGPTLFAFRSSVDGFSANI